MDGNFYYIGDIQRIDECFMDALGGLFSVVSNNVQVQIKVKDCLNVQVGKTYGDAWKKISESEFSM